MLLIYSICRTRARHQISFPSVFRQSDQDWTIACGGAEIKPDTDYLVFGEVKSLGGEPFLAIETAIPTTSLPYFTRVFGRGNEDGALPGGLLTDSQGDFAGELVAIDQSLLVVLGLETCKTPSPAPINSSEAENPSAKQAILDVSSLGLASTRLSSCKDDAGSALPAEKASKTKSPCPIPNDGDVKLVGEALPDEQDKKPAQPVNLGKTGGGGQPNPVQSGVTPEAAPEPTPEPTKEKPSVKTTEAGTHTRDPQKDTKVVVGDGGTVGDAGEGVSGTVITVLSSPDQPFPESGPIPELAGVKRSELARKADARKKGSPGPVKIGKPEIAVSSSGIKLGRDLGGDKKSSLVQNSIDEDELW